MMPKLVAHYRRMMARMDSQLEKMNTTYLVDSQEKLDAIVDKLDVPKREAVVETIRALVVQCGYWH
jgi:hypothetical protein